MPKAPVTADVPQPQDVLATLPPQLSLDHVVFVHQGGEPGQFVFAKVRARPCGSTPALWQRSRAIFGPTPYKYLSEITVGRSFGISTPNRRGIFGKLLVDCRIQEPATMAAARKNYDPSCPGVV